MFRSAQNEAEAIVVHSTQNKPSKIALQPTQDELPPFPTNRVSISPKREGRSTSLEEAALLIANLKDVITQQSSLIANRNNTIRGIQANLTAIITEQQNLKGQNVELQEEIRFL